VAFGGAFASRKYRQRQNLARQERRHVHPLFPPSKVQAALAIADGRLNGQRVCISGREVLIKGTTKVSLHTWKEERTTDRGTAIDTHNVTRRTPFVVTLDEETGTVCQYTGDTGMARLMDIPDAPQSLIDAFQRSVPSRYSMEMPPEVAAILAGIKPASGRHLPGYPPGLLPMQRHLCAALYTAYTQHHPTSSEPPLSALILSAEMGAGKTALGAAEAELLYHLDPGNAGRAYTVLVVAPNHLIGERKDVEVHDKASPGKRHAYPLPPWIAEWRDLLPHWATEILETPAQVAAFSRSAELNPATPRVGFISLSKISLTCGREVAVTTHRPQLPAGENVARKTFYKQLVVEEDREFRAMQERKKKARRAQREAAIADTERRQKQHPSGVSDRTIARDRLLRAGCANESQAPFWHYDGVYCPDCGRRVLTREGSPHDQDSLFRAGMIPCAYCGCILGQLARKQDNVSDRNLPVWAQLAAKPPLTETALIPVKLGDEEILSWTYFDEIRAIPSDPAAIDALLADGTLIKEIIGEGDEAIEVLSWTRPAIRPPIPNEPEIVERLLTEGRLMKRRVPIVTFKQVSRPVIPWGKMPVSNPRIALGEFIAKRFPGKVDLFICDECHLMKGKTTARGRVFGMLVEASKRTLGMTGTLYGGKASTVFSLLQRLGNRQVRAEFSWDNELDFIRRMGVLDTVQTDTFEEDAQVLRGKPAKTFVRVMERAGITAELAGIVQGQAVMILLKQMGFHLPSYHEGVVFLDMPGSLADAYAKLEQKGKEIIRAPGGKDALSSYLQATLTYPLKPSTPVTISSKNGLSYRAPEFPGEMILPHHEWLARHCADAIKAGRRVLIFCEHTRRLDLMPDVQAKIIELAQARHSTQLNVAILRSTTVKPGRRAAWFADREADGTNVVLCHPSLVETGLNLIGWPEIVFLEPTYKLYCAMQARKRAMRPTQTRDCNVTWLAYADTMMEQAMDVIGTKATAASLLTGDDLSSGLLQFDPGMSLLQELARRVLNDEKSTRPAVEIQARLQAAGQATVAAMQVGAADLVGVSEALALNLSPAPPTIQAGSESTEAVELPLLELARGAPLPVAGAHQHATAPGATQLGLLNTSEPVNTPATSDPTSTADAGAEPSGRWVSFHDLPKRARAGAKRGSTEGPPQQASMF
jgi:hypothetical protein